MSYDIESEHKQSTVSTQNLRARARVPHYPDLPDSSLDSSSEGAIRAVTLPEAARSSQKHSWLKGETAT